MNLIDESFEPKKTDNSKKIAKIILIVMVLLIIGIIAIFGVIIYIQNSQLKLYVDGVQNDKVKNMMVQENDGTIYFPIKELANTLGYQSFNGDYSDKSEDQSKCYIQNEDEVVNFVLNSNKLYSLITTDSNSNYNYFYIDKPVKAINGNLYASIDAIEQAFNISFTYNTDNQRIYIYTMPYLITSYSTKVLDYGYKAISDEYINQKTVLNDMLIVTKGENSEVYGVIDLNGNTIIETKYDNIEYLPNSGDFLVTSNNKVGIISAKRETKVQILYDSLDLIDSDLGLYLAKRENKYGVIDSKGNIKIYIEYDQIGIDSTKFEKNEIKNKYLLDNGMIPAKKGDKWGTFDRNGNQILDFIYDGFGYIASSNKDAINLLMIPDYNVLVASRDKKYTLINSAGRELCAPVLDDVYMTISGGQKHYYMNYNNKTGVDVIDFLDSQGVNPRSDNSQYSNNDSERNENETNGNNIIETNVNE